MQETDFVPQQHKRCALAVMVKAPRDGMVKTRLVPPLGFDEAAALSRCFLRDTIENIERVAIEEKAEGVVVYTPVGAEALFNDVLPEGFDLLAQRGELLGERLTHAAEDLLARGYESFCLINADSPTLPHALLAQAVKALARTGDRVVLGAADDGGYYLVGLKALHPQLFEHINWSTEKVLAETLERAREINLEVEMLSTWYDIDDEASLYRLCLEMFSEANEKVEQTLLVGSEAPYTRHLLAQLIGSGRLPPLKEMRKQVISLEKQLSIN